MHTTKKFKDLTQKKRQLSHFLNFYVFLTVELPWLVLYYRSFPESRQQEFIETIKTMARMTLQDDYR